MLSLLAALILAAGPPRTFRVDYFHTGQGGKEVFSLDRLVVEPLSWPGTPARAVDDTGFGKWRAIQVERKKIRAERPPEGEMDALFTREKAEVTRLLNTDTYSGKVGAFEGANYESHGFYRPQEDCIMFTRDEVPFCKVCQSAISRIIDLYTGGPSR